MVLASVAAVFEHMLTQNKSVYMIAKKYICGHVIYEITML